MYRDHGRAIFIPCGGSRGRGSYQNIRANRRISEFFSDLCFANRNAAKLSFDDELALHTTMADPATVAAMERIRSWCTRHKLHCRWNARLDLETVFTRTEDESGITFRVRSVGVEIDLETMRLIERGDSQLHCSPKLYANGRRGVVILFGGNVNDLHTLVRLVRLISSRRTSEGCGDREPAQHKQANNSRYVIHLFVLKNGSQTQRLHLTARLPGLGTEVCALRYIPIDAGYLENGYGTYQRVYVANPNRSSSHQSISTLRIHGL
jgi:hypothetical protein